MTALRPCLGSGDRPCPSRALTRDPRGLCRSCRQTRYGSRHRKLHESLEPAVHAGTVTCWRCRRPIKPTDDWQLGHDDDHAGQYAAPEHRICNEGASAGGLFF
jgi:hypothetical protein